MNDNRRGWLAFLLAVLFGAVPVRAEEHLKYVVIVIRHGVRSPTWKAERLHQYSTEPWPDWGAATADLTPHGRVLMQLFGSYYREWLVKEHVLASQGCGDLPGVYVWADTDQRTLETGRALAESLLPGCGLTVHSRGAGEKDPIFSGVADPDPELAEKSVRDRLGTDPQKLLADHRAALDTLQTILTGGGAAPKRLIEAPGEIGIERQGKAIELKGPFAVASTLSEDLLLEYTNGMRGSDLGWGRLTSENLFKVMELHSVYADLMRRTPYLARVRSSNLLAHVLASMEQAASGKPVAGALGEPTTKVLILAGHDTNLSNLSGMLGLTWALPGYQPDDTPPGGALIFSLWSEAGATRVRAEYTAQSLDQMHDAARLTLKDPPESASVSMPGCGATGRSTTCSWQMFREFANKALDRSRIDAGF